MSFDTAWFEELRSLTEGQIRETRERGIVGYVPRVGELCRDGHVTREFLNETRDFVHMMNSTHYPFAEYFRAYPQHVVNFPNGRAFRKQWNIAFTAGDSRDEDQVRIGIGFRLSPNPTPNAEAGVMEYFEFREQVRERQADFNQTFRALGNYYEIENSERSVSGSETNALSDIVIADEPERDEWRFFGRRLWIRDPQNEAVVSSHERLRDTMIDIYDRIRDAGFGM